MDAKSIDLLLRVLPLVISFLSLIVTLSLAKRVSVSKTIKEKQLETIIAFMEEFTKHKICYYYPFIDPNLFYHTHMRDLRPHLFYGMNTLSQKVNGVFYTGNFEELFPFVEHRNNVFLPPGIRAKLLDLYRYQEWTRGVVVKVEELKDFCPIVFLKTEPRYLEKLEGPFLRMHGKDLDKLIGKLDGITGALNDWLTKFGGEDLVLKKWRRGDRMQE